MAINNQWQRIVLTRNEYESGEAAVLLGAFRAVYIARNGLAGMAMYGAWSDDQQAYFVYLSPKSIRYVQPILHAYSAKAVAPPDAKWLSWLYGDDSEQIFSSAEFEA